MKKVCLNLSECNGLGDLICATPTIKKLSQSYEQKIIVISKMPELFKCNPNVEASYKASSIDWDYFNSNYIMHNSFYNVGKKNERGIEYKHNVMDIRQFHAINLGFMLAQNELQCEYHPITQLAIQLPEKYILIHPVTSWASRTWSLENWIALTQKLNEVGYEVIAIGKDSSETGFFNVQKPVFDLQIANKLNLMNNTSISDCWNLMQKAEAFVTMDSGLLHLAGTTNVPIIHLGSSIKPEFRIPYRYGNQSKMFYNNNKLVYQYVRGGCGLECASNMKYALEYWDDINSVPPLIGCLEKKATYECHPSFEQVLESIKNIIWKEL
jgi:ADP-heptose:LPS heptosyltransferase